MNNAQEKPSEGYDFTRNDKVYSLSIPSYQIQEELVLYEIQLKDLVNNKQYLNHVRFKSLKEIHDRLVFKHFVLPDFPKTHFWKKTNKNPALIEERRKMLEIYLNAVINDPYLRGYRDVKRFVQLFKQQQQVVLRLSLQKKARTSVTKSRSLSNSNVSRDKSSKSKPISVRNLKLTKASKK